MISVTAVGGLRPPGGQQGDLLELTMGPGGPCGPAGPGGPLIYKDQKVLMQVCPRF